MNDRRAAQDPPTIAAIAVLAATLAAICHETLGHGIGCLAVGGRVTLLTSIWFRCESATALTDMGGPIGNLIAGGIAATLLAPGAGGGRLRLFLALLCAFSLFWLFGQLLHDAAINSDDIAFAAREAGLPALWRPAALVLGLAGYVGTTRWTARRLREQAITGQAVRLAYAAALLSALIAALAWRTEPGRSAVQALLTFGLAPFGLLVAGARKSGSPAAAPGIVRSWSWIATAALAFALFVLIQGQGLGPLARIGLA